MSFDELYEHLSSKFGTDQLAKGGEDFLQPFLLVQRDTLQGLVAHLQKDPTLHMDFLSSISGVDRGPEKGEIEVVYHLTSLTKNINITLKVVVSRDEASIPSIVETFKGANWLEREVYDLFGVHFESHPDLRRILLPTNWEGHPLRKDYKEQETYHGVKVAYE
jgi:NADH-quinone oxidoreductase subunit C